MPTTLDIVTATLKELGVLAIGETAPAEDATDALDALNRLIDQWAAERLQIYTVTRNVVAITGSPILLGTPSASIVTNGTFETFAVSGVATGWTGVSTGGLLFSSAGAPVHGGAFSQSIVATAGGTGYIYQNITARSQQQLTMGVWGQTSGASFANAYLQNLATLNYLQPDMTWGATRNSIASSFAGAGSWGQLTATFVSEQAPSTLQLQLEGVVPAGTSVFFDDVTFTSPVDMPRPVFIDHVNYQDTSPTLTTEYPLERLTEDGFAGLTLKTMTSVFPVSWYYNPTFPYGTLTLWPAPTSTTLQAVIYVPTAVTEFPALNTPVLLPPGYKRMIVKNLAVELAPGYGREVSDVLREQASKSMAVVKAANRRLSDLSFEPAALIGHGGGWSIYTGP